MSAPATHSAACKRFSLCFFPHHQVRNPNQHLDPGMFYVTAAYALINVFHESEAPQAQQQSTQQAEAAEHHAVGRSRPVRQAGRIDNAELLSLLTLLQIGRHLRLHLLLQNRVVILLGLLIVAGQVGHLLFGQRRLVQAALILADLPLHVGQAAPRVLNFLSVGLELSLDLQNRGHRLEFRRCRGSPLPHGGPSPRDDSDSSCLSIFSTRAISPRRWITSGCLSVYLVCASANWPFS